MKYEHFSQRKEARDATVSRATLLVDAAALARYLRDLLSGQVAIQPDAGIISTARVAAVLAPLYARDGHPHVIFTLRSLDLTRHSGEISFPGGRQDANDASLEATALRESYEALRLDPARVDVLGPLPSVFAGVSNYLVVPFVGWLGEELPPLIPNPSEVAEVIDIPLADLADPAIYHSEIWHRGGAEHLVHFYDVGRYRIWGATGRMLFSLLTLLPPS